MNLLSNEVGAILGESGLTVLIGIVVVFGVLLLLTGVFKLFGMVVSKLGNQDKPQSVSAPAAAAAPVAPKAPAAAPIVGNTEEVRSTPEVQNRIPEETVAVISAAVGSMAPAGSQYAVRGIRKM